jgi:hypothetical protein
VIAQTQGCLPDPAVQKCRTRQASGCETLAAQSSIAVIAPSAKLAWQEILLFEIPIVIDARSLAAIAAPFTGPADHAAPSLLLPPAWRSYI